MNRQCCLALKLAAPVAALVFLIPIRARSKPLHQKKAVIAAQGTLATHAAAAGKKIRFTLTLSNTGSLPSGPLWLETGKLASYSITRLCAWRGDQPKCQSVNSTGPPAGPIPAIAPGDSEAVTGTLTVSKASEPQAVTLVVGWHPKGGAAETTAVSMGTLEPKPAKRMQNDWWYLGLKDLLLPIVLIALPFIIGFILRRRSQVNQTWNLMLPKSYELMTCHYMPLDGSLKRIITKLDDYFKKKDEWNDERTAKLLYEMALFGRRTRRMGKAAGGFYFKNRMGEVLAAGCLRAYHLILWGNPAREKVYSMLLNHVAPFETLDSFLNKLGPLSKVDSGQALDVNVPLETCLIFRMNFGALKKWLEENRAFDPVKEQEKNEVQKAYRYLCVLHAVLRFEMNRPFEFWYDSREPFEIDKATRRFLENNAQDIGEGYSVDSFKKQLKTYLSLSSKRNELARPTRWERFLLWLGV